MLRGGRAAGRTLPTMAVSAVLVLAVACVDYATGFEVSVVLLYLIPVAWSAWFAGQRDGVYVAIASAIGWLVADLLGRGGVGHPLVPLWNTLMMAGIFVVVAVLLAARRHAQDHLEDVVARRTTMLSDEIAERRAAELHLRHTNAELQRTQIQLIDAAKLESVGRMAAGVAHEVKNPLMTLAMAADYFQQRGSDNADEAALLQDMQHAVRRASHIINLMLDFSRPHPLNRAPEDLNVLVDDALALVRHQLVKQRIEVVRHLAADLPLLALDRTRLEHVLINLYTNAAQAMPDGGTLTVWTRRDPAISPRAATVVVDVDDTGPGIAPEHLAKVCEPFFTTKPPGQGTGLGLAIVHRIIQIHGGSLAITNRPGGVRVSLRFQLAAKDPP